LDYEIFITKKESEVRDCPSKIKNVKIKVIRSGLKNGSDEASRKPQ